MAFSLSFPVKEFQILKVKFSESPNHELSEIPKVDFEKIKISESSYFELIEIPKFYWKLKFRKFRIVKT